MDNKKGTAANREGMGSTYSGTQTPDPQAPDGYQLPEKGSEEQEHGQQADQHTAPGQEPLGSEYEEDDSYGDKAPATGKKPTGDGDQGTAEGSPIR